MSTSFVWMVVVSDPDYWDYYGWENTDAVGALFSTLQGAEKFRAELHSEQYADYDHTTGEKTPEEWAEITGLVVNNE